MLFSKANFTYTNCIGRHVEIVSYWNCNGNGLLYIKQSSGHGVCSVTLNYHAFIFSRLGKGKGINKNSQIFIWILYQIQQILHRWLKDTQSDLIVGLPNKFFRRYYSILLSLNRCNSGMPKKITYKYQKKKYLFSNRAMACYSGGKLQYPSIQSNLIQKKSQKDESEVIQHRMRFKSIKLRLKSILSETRSNFVQKDLFSPHQMRLIFFDIQYLQ